MQRLSKRRIYSAVSTRSVNAEVIPASTVVMQVIQAYLNSNFTLYCLWRLSNLTFIINIIVLFFIKIIMHGYIYIYMCVFVQWNKINIKQ